MTETQKKLDDLDAVRTISNALSGFKSDEQQRIMRWVQEKMNMVFLVNNAQHAQENPVPAENHDIAPNDRSSSRSGTDIRSFIAFKKPSSDNQFAACVAYYYMFEANSDEQKETITPTDLQDATRKAGRTRLGDPSKTLANASAQGWLDKKDRGNYAINTVGENLVAMTLPSSSSDGVPIKRKRAKKKPASAAKQQSAKVSETKKTKKK